MKSFIIMVAMFFFGFPSVHATPVRAHLEWSGENAGIPTLSFDSQDLELKKLKSDDQKVIADVRGEFHDPESHLVMNDEIVSVKNNGKFNVEVPLQNDKKEILIQVVDFEGNIKRAKVWIVPETESPKIAQKDAEVATPPSEPSPQTFATPASPPPAPTGARRFSLRVSTGPNLIVLNQSGALGGHEKETVNALGWSANLMADFGKFNGELEYQRVSPNLDGASNPIQSLSLRAGYRFVFVGLQETTLPIGAFLSSNNITWRDFSVFSPLLGVHFDWGFEKDEHPDAFRKSVDFEGKLPAFALKDSSADPLTADSLAGYGLRFRGRIEKSIYDKGPLKFWLGVEGDAAFQDLHFNGTLDGSSGRIESILQVYQGLITFNAEI